MNSLLISPFARRSRGVGFDSDAFAFFTAASITDPTQRNAVNTLVVGLKANSLWTKCVAIYPFVGGSATSHKFNLKNPADTDAAFRLSFSGGWTHDANGALPNGTNAVAETYIVLSTALSASPHMSYYSRTNGNTNTDQIDIGVSSGSQLSWISAWYKASGFNNVLARNTSSTVLLDGGVTSDSRGLYQINKVGTSSKLQRNDTILDTETDTQSNPTVFTVRIGCLNAGGNNSLFTNRQCAFASIGNGFSDAEAVTFYNLVQAYQTALSRNV